MKVLVVFYSTYGHVYKMAKATLQGAGEVGDEHLGGGQLGQAGRVESLGVESGQCGRQHAPHRRRVQGVRDHSVAQRRGPQRGRSNVDAGHGCVGAHTVR